MRDFDAAVRRYTTHWVRILIYANVLVWITYVILIFFVLPWGTIRNEIYLNYLFGCTPSSILGGRVWQFFTYMFVHDPRYIGHLFFNMLMLWFFGSVIEQHFGSRRFIRFYLLCGVSASIVYEVVNLLRIFVWGAEPSLLVPMIGASGAIYGVLFAFGYLYPDQPILLGFIIPVPARVLIGFLIFFSVLGSLGLTNDTTAHLCHLAGMGFAYVYLKWPTWRNPRRGPQRVYRDMNFR